jgi:O-antigen/teichoic acid export membrane protein
MGTSPEFSRPLSEVPVSRRGTAALFYVISWSFANLVITFVASLVLARLLSPRDFGMIALGQTVATLAAAASEGGIASGFVRQSEGISRNVLQAINGVQLLIAMALATAITPVALNFGLAGSLAAVIVWTLPIVSLQTAGRVVFLRELRFRDIAIVEAVGVIVYYTWSIVGVLAGYGVWSLATGMLARSGAATSAVGLIVGWRVLVPSFKRYRDVLAVMGFGIRFSLTLLVNTIYEQIKNIVIVLIAGTSTLGLWSLASRVLQIPYLMYNPINQLAFPAFSQMNAAARDLRPVMERVTRLSFVTSTLTLPAFLVAIPGMITVLFGSQWTDAALIFPGVICAIFIGLPITAPCIQFLYAMGRASDVLRITMLAIVVNLASIALLLWLIGVSGIGFGTVPGAAIESALLARIVHGINGANLIAMVPKFVVAGLLAVAGGFAVVTGVGHEGLGAMLGAATACVVAATICLVSEKATVFDLLSLGRRSVSTAFAGEH